MRRRGLTTREKAELSARFTELASRLSPADRRKMGQEMILAAQDAEDALPDEEKAVEVLKSFVRRWTELAEAIETAAPGQL